MKEKDLLHALTMMTKILPINVKAIQRIQIAQKTFGKGYWGEAFLVLAEILEFQMNLQPILVTKRGLSKISYS